MRIDKMDKEKERKKIQKYLEQAYKINKKFYGFDIKLGIKLIYTRKEFDSYFKKKTPRWACGAIKRNKIIIFAPSVFEKKTIHKLSIYNDTILHEMNHLFYWKLAGDYKPWWLSEGLALNLEKNYKTRIKKINPKELFYTWTFNISKYTYPTSYLAVKKLIKKLGKRKLLNLIKRYSKNPKKLNYLLKEKL